MSEGLNVLFFNALHFFSFVLSCTLTLCFCLISFADLQHSLSSPTLYYNDIDSIFCSFCLLACFFSHFLSVFFPSLYTAVLKISCVYVCV